MTVVPCILLHEVLPHPPHRHGLLTENKAIVQFRALKCNINGSALGPVELKVILGARWIGLYEVCIRGIGSVIQVGHRLRAEGLPHPPAFGVAHVPNQPEQRQVGRYNGAHRQLRSIQASTLAEQGGTVPVEPVAEHFVFGFVAAFRVVVRTLDIRCDPSHCGSLCPSGSERWERPPPAIEPISAQLWSGDTWPQTN